MKNPSINNFQIKFNLTKNFNKCFGIGANKTGTTSLEAICKKFYGMRSEQKPGVACIHQIFKGNYSTLKQHLDNQDFHQDLPASLNHYYVALDILYPNSKFILTLRESKSWFTSFFNYYFSSKIKPYIYPNLNSGPYHIFEGHERWFEVSWGQELSLLKDLKHKSFQTDEHLKELILKNEFFVNSCILSYENRISSIQTYFADREKDLLQVKISDPNLSKKINRFFGLPENIITYKAPSANAARKTTNNIQQAFS